MTTSKGINKQRTVMVDGVLHRACRDCQRLLPLNEPRAMLTVAEQATLHDESAWSDD
jgi:hypothetical protein